MSVDLTTQYLGIPLRNPLVVAACPLTKESYRLAQLEQAGAAAAVMFSLFEEQIEGEETDAFGESGIAQSGYSENLSNLMTPQDYAAGLDSYLRRIELAKKEVSIPIIGSLNGAQPGDWVRSASLIQDSGADALELNLYFVPVDPTVTSSQLEAQYLETVAAVREQITIPLSVKLSPFISSLPNVVAQLAAAGVDGVVLFNRFLQPDIDIEKLEVVPRLTLSSRDELRLPLRWIAILRSQVSLSLAASSGAHVCEDVVKLLLAGADVVTMASALIEHGPDHLAKVISELEQWLADKGFESISQIHGLVSQSRHAHPEAFERANYARTLTTWERPEESE